jgi:hypothetical protein
LRSALPRLEVVMMAFIVVKFNEPLIRVMYLVSLQPDPRDGLVDRLPPARRRSSFVHGQCLNEGVPKADKLASETFCRGVEPRQLLGPDGLPLCSVHCVGRVDPLLGGVRWPLLVTHSCAQVRERSCTSQSLFNFSYADCAITIGAQRNENTSVSVDCVY